MTKMIQYRDVALYPGHRLLFILTVGGAWGMAMAMYMYKNMWVSHKPYLNICGVFFHVTDRDTFITMNRNASSLVGLSVVMVTWTTVL